MSLIKTLQLLFSGRKHRKENDDTNKSELSLEQKSALELFGISFAENSNNIPDNSMSKDCVECIFENFIIEDVLNDEMILLFDEKVLQMEYVTHPEITPGHIDIAKIAELFCHNHHYMKVLNDHNKMHSPEKVRLKCLFDGCHDDAELIRIATEEVSQSFMRISHANCIDGYINIVWAKYLNLVSQYTSIMPESLLTTIDNKNYIPRFNHMKKMYEKSCTRYDSLQNARIKDLSIQICKWILEKIDERDAPSLLFLGKIYKKMKYYKEAQACFNKVLDIADSHFNGVTALAECYSAEIVEINNKMKRGCDIKALQVEVTQLNTQLQKLYQQNIEILSRSLNGEESINENTQKSYVSLICKYARWLKAMGRYEECLDVLNRIDVDCPEYHRVFLEKGFLYQNYGRGYNHHYDLEKAEYCFVEAEKLLETEIIDNNEKQKIQKSILVPLANTYFYQKRYSTAYEVCEKVLKLDSRDTNALKLIDRIAMKMANIA